MKWWSLLLAINIAAAGPLHAAEAFSTRPVHTYSIVARDAATGQMGVAVQSHWFSVGSVVTWAEAGVGAVATQSFADPAYGARGLGLMRSGLKASQALDALLETDAGQAVRQVAFVDNDGEVATHTGARCIEMAGHQTGPGYSVQANMMLNDKVVPAMALAYETTEGDLATRLVSALIAAQQAGGDIRGRQSAAILIVAAENTGQPWADRVLELRVEDHDRPVMELQRLVDVWRAYEHMNQGDVAMEQGDMASALTHYSAAAENDAGNLEIQYWQALTLATNGMLEKALPVFRKVFKADPNWVELTRRLIKPGLVPDDPDGRRLIEQITAVAPGND